MEVNWQKSLWENYEVFLPLIDYSNLVLAIKTFAKDLSFDETEIKTGINDKKLFLIKKLISESDISIEQVVELFLFSGHDAIAYKLNPNCIDLVNLKRGDPKSSEILIREDIVFKPNSHSQLSLRSILSQDYYKMHSTPKGFCLIVNNCFTYSTFKEMQRLRNIFFQLKFDVTMKKNLNTIELFKYLFTLSKRKELKNHDMFVFLLISRCNKKFQLLGLDGSPYGSELLTEIFDDENCPLLKNKPRLFFINSCFDNMDDKFNLGGTVPVPKLNDFLVCIAVFQGNPKEFGKNNNTLFGKLLSDILVRKSLIEDISHIMVMLNAFSDEAREKDKQFLYMNWNSGLKKRLFLNPVSDHEGNNDSIEHYNIEKKLNLISKFVDIEKLMEPLRYKRFKSIFNRIDFINNGNISDYESKRKMVGYCLNENKKEFLALLLHTGQTKAAKIIEPSVTDVIDVSILDPKNGRVHTNFQYIHIDLEGDRLFCHQKSESTFYSYLFEKSPRGYCVIINNYLTFGTLKEIQRYRNIFYQLHFEVIIEFNLTADKTLQKLCVLSEDPLIATHEAFCCIIISRKYGRNISGSDNKKINIKDLCNIFDDTNCSNMRGKPRIFLFTCCNEDEKRTGDHQNPGGSFDLSSMQPWISVSYAKSTFNDEIPSNQRQSHFKHVKKSLKKKITLPTLTDFLICSTTMDENSAYINWDSSSKFGSEFCNTLVKKSFSRDLIEILISTINKVGWNNSIYWTNGLTRHLYLSPDRPFVRVLH